MAFLSSTRHIPEAAAVPRHVAMIMDGNGRWAKQRFLPRVAGHKRGVETVRAMVKACIERGVEFLTLFAFSSENWRRPAEEVSFLMNLFVAVLDQEVGKLHANGVRLRIVGDPTPFEPRLRELIRRSEDTTAANTRLTLTVAANYGGRWDVMQAVNRMSAAHPEKVGNYGEEDIAPHLAMAYAPEPDIFIRTGGEQRISNFLIWQLAYTELYFTDLLWPEFDAASLDAAIASYHSRERRFGRTSEQLLAVPPAPTTGLREQASPSLAQPDSLDAEGGTFSADLDNA
ncbi:MAG: polyprenyl diphosphate synthase [Sulfurisoma sp.]|nr:polyprenyl diphosphate synthase [Sulfurisoma sp.]